MGGWIKAWRKMLENPYLQDPAERGVFLKLLLVAQQKRSEILVENTGRVITLERGQAWTSIRGLAGKHTSVRTIRTILSNLKKGAIIDTHIDTGITVVTICNYEQYQALKEMTDTASDKPPTHDRHTEQEREEEEDSKKEKNIRSARSENGHSAPNGAYRFEGKIIRLNNADYETWKKRYHAIPDFDCQLGSLDDFYDETLIGKDRSKWFIRASSALQKRHQEMMADRVPPSTGYTPSKGLLG